MDNQISLETLRHSTAHVMAAAVLELFPGTKLGVGPVIENGFFYDFDPPRPFKPEDLARIEKRMREIAKRKDKFSRKTMSLEEAIAYFKEHKQEFKVDLLEDLKKHGTTKVRPEESADVPASGQIEEVSIYETGKFTDLCRGPHVENAGQIGVFKLTSLAGAYWRGSEKNKQLQRIYGLAFATDEELQKYMAMMAEAEKRDHRKLGAELGLFVLSPLVGSGLPIFTPKGTLIRELLQTFLREEQLKRGYCPIWSPHIGSIELYKKSGHWPYYKDTMYPPIVVDDEQYILKPMNCPHHIQVYKNEMHSYRNLPIKLSEFGTVYRYEKSGELTGLTRVRGITQDDAHLFVREDQIEEQVGEVLELTLTVCKKLGLKDFQARLSLRDPENKTKYVGSDAVWNRAESDLRNALKNNKLDFFEAKGEAAFYGPKIDFIVKDVIGREWQMGTIQLDYNLPERFDLEYTGQDGKKYRPIIIHRAPFGSVERFMGILIEHFAGAFPLWLSPRQVFIAPVGKAHYSAARKLGKMLAAGGLRVEVDEARESVPYKVRKAEKQKIPYILVIGDREKALKKLTVRIRGMQKQKQMAVSAFIKRLQKEIAGRLITMSF